MAINFDVVPEPDLARVAIQANNGVPGDSFYILRRDRNGSRLVRETSEAGVVWQSDPSSLRTNYATNPVLSVDALNWAATYGTGGSNTVKQLVPNPLASPSATTVEIGRNRVVNPKFSGGTGGVPTTWATYSYLTTSSGTRNNTTTPGTLIMSATGQVANARFGETTTCVMSSTNGGNVPFSAKVKFTKSGAGGSAVLWAEAWNGATNLTPASPSVVHTDSSTASSGELVVNYKVGSTFDTIKFYLWIENKTASTIAGTTTVEFTDPIFSTGQTGWSPEMTRYFDGSMDSDEDSDYTWAGTANASESIRTVHSTTGFWQGPPGGVSSIASVVADGVTNVAIFPNQAATTDTFLNPGVAAGDAGAMRLGMVAGTNYTVRARITLLGPQTGTLHANARTLVGIFKSTSGGTVTRISAAAPNAAGSTDLAITMNLPADTTEAYVRLYNGAALGGGAVLWTNVFILPSSYEAVGGQPFTGDDEDSPYINYSWDGTPNLSASTKTGIQGRVSDNGGYAYQMAWVYPNVGGSAGITYVENTSGVNGDVWSAKEKVIVSRPTDIKFIIRYRLGTTTVNQSMTNTISLAANTWTEVGLDGVAATGTFDNIMLWPWPVTPTADFAPGDWIRCKDVLLEKAATAGGFFTGSTDDPAYSGWNGTAGQSTSWISPSSLPITIYDYEARQGLDTSYVLTDELGNIGATEDLLIPSWGTWLKDPFRPFNNVKVLWNSDDTYTRKARRELFLARGSKFPVPQWDVRQAPDGNIVVATETEDQAIDLTNMLNAAGVIMIDTALEFGVPVRYVSVGDVSGSRASSEKDRGLTWEARIWTLQVDEVAYPVGSPMGQGLTYSDVAGRFDSYLALATTVETYADLAAGNWGE